MSVAHSLSIELELELRGKLGLGKNFFIDDIYLWQDHVEIERIAQLYHFHTQIVTPEEGKKKIVFLKVDPHKDHPFKEALRHLRTQQSQERRLPQPQL